MNATAAAYSVWSVSSSLGELRGVVDRADERRRSCCASRASWLALPRSSNSDRGSCCGCDATRASSARAPSPGGCSSFHAEASVVTSARKSSLMRSRSAADRVLRDVHLDRQRTRLERERDQQPKSGERYDDCEDCTLHGGPIYVIECPNSRQKRRTAAVIGFTGHGASSLLGDSALCRVERAFAIDGAPLTSRRDERFGPNLVSHEISSSHRSDRARGPSRARDSGRAAGLGERRRGRGRPGQCGRDTADASGRFKKLQAQLRGLVGKAIGDYG